MKKYILQFSLLLIAVLLHGTAFAQTLKGRVVGIVDGDTVTIRVSDKSQKTIHIAGIDAPEKEQRFGAEARQKLTELLLDKEVTVESSAIEPNGEIYGKILLNRADAGTEMMTTGFAWCRIRPEESAASELSGPYCIAEKESRLKRIGLWKDDAPQSPWEFRINLSNRRAAYSDNNKNRVEGQVTEIIGSGAIAIETSDTSRVVVCINRLETPEPGQPKADIAKKHLEDLLLRKYVRVSIVGFPEDENCVVGEVYLNDINVNLQMVRDGVAWVNKDYYYPEGYGTYALAQQAARTERRGIWEDPAPVAPWEYRGEISAPGERGADGASSGRSYPEGADYGGGANKTVHVRGHFRSNGTYVQPHTRSAPGSGGSRRRN